MCYLFSSMSIKVEQLVGTVVGAKVAGVHTPVDMLDKGGTFLECMDQLKLFTFEDVDVCVVAADRKVSFIR